MKNLYLSFLILVISIHSYSQTEYSGCLPEGIQFTNQADIDSFQINYPGCSEIEGSVRIGYSIGDYYLSTDIDDLSNLLVLNKIGGSLEIIRNDSLEQLYGLDSLTTVGGYRLHLHHNASLVDISALSSLDSIGNSLIISDNNNLPNLHGLDKITSLNNLQLGIIIEGSTHKGNDSLSDLTGLKNLKSIGGLNIIGRHNFEDLTGFDSLQNVDGISIQRTQNLISLNGLQQLNSIPNDLILRSNTHLSSLLGLDNVTSIGGDCTFWVNDTISDISALSNLETIGGKLTMIGVFVTDLSGYQNLKTIGDGLIIRNLDRLKGLSGLDSLTSIGGRTLEITSNDSLLSLSGIDHILWNTIGFVEILGNPLLSTCEVRSICDRLSLSDSGDKIWSNYQGCNSREEVLTACGYTSIRNNNNTNTILIYPNPASNEIFIESKNRVKIGSVKIYNQVGQTVLQEEEPNNRVDVSTLSKGIYIIKTVTKEHYYTEKLIIE